ncbi:hypothetical protein LCGC14_2503100, partial [marine sediment metagenome]
MGNVIHPPLCQCDQCRTAHKRKDQAGATVVHQFVTTIQTLKQELLLGEAKYRIADSDRLDLLRMIPALATAYHEHGIQIYGEWESEQMKIPMAVLENPSEVEKELTSWLNKQEEDK